MKIAIVIDSSAGLTAKQTELLGWHLLPLGITIDDKYFADGVDIDLNSIYDYFGPKSKVQTSASNLGVVEDLFDKLSKENDHVVVYPISVHLSGQYSNLLLASKKYNNVHIVKSQKLAGLIPLSLFEFEDLINDGIDFETALATLNTWRDNDAIYLIPKSNDRLVAGGRLSPGAASVAKLLRIVPVIRFDHGELLKDSKGMVFSKVVKSTMQRITEDAHDTLLSPFILHANNAHIDDFAEEFETISKETVTRIKIPSVIAIHTGLEAIALANVNYTQAAVARFRKLLRDLED